MKLPSWLIWYFDLFLLSGCAILYACGYLPLYERFSYILTLVALSIFITRCNAMSPLRATTLFGGFITTTQFLIMFSLPSNFMMSLGQPVSIGYVFLLIICAFQALPFAVAFFIYRYLEWQYTWYGPLCGGALLTVFFAIWPGIFPGSFYHAFLFEPTLNAPAYTLGIYGYAWLWNTLILGLPSLWFAKNKIPTSIPILLCLFIFPISTAIRNISHPTEIKTLETMIVQDSLLHTTDKHLFTYVDEQLAFHPKTKLVVFPESGIINDSRDSIDQRLILLRTLQHIADRRHVSILFTWYRKPENQEHMVTTSTLVSPGKPLAFRDKKILLPFGEYQPKWTQYFGNFGIPLEKRVAYVAGEKSDRFVVDGISIATFICYESIFPHFTEQLLQGDEQIAILQSNLNDFSANLAVVWVHMALDAHIAVTHHIPLLRVIRAGGSTVTKSNGQVDHEMQDFSWNTPFYWVTLRTGHEPFLPRLTIDVSVKIGLLCIVLWTFGLLWRSRRRSN